MLCQAAACAAAVCCAPAVRPLCLLRVEARCLARSCRKRSRSHLLRRMQCTGSERRREGRKQEQQEQEQEEQQQQQEQQEQAAGAAAAGSSRQQAASSSGGSCSSAIDCNRMPRLLSRPPALPPNPAVLAAHRTQVQPRHQRQQAHHRLVAVPETEQLRWQPGSCSVAAAAGGTGGRTDVLTRRRTPSELSILRAVRFLSCGPFPSGY